MCSLFGDLARCGGALEGDTHSAGLVLELAQNPNRTVRAVSLEAELASVEVWRSSRFGR
jgi:hypothetical protein